MSNPSDWNHDDLDDADADEVDEREFIEDEGGDASEEEEEEYEDEHEDDEEGRRDAHVSDGCFWTMMAALLFWTALTFAALGLCTLFGVVLQGS